MQRMIFVVGNSRSGTTMMGRVLGGHSQVFTFHELHFFEQLWNAGREPKLIGLKAAVTLAAKLLTTQRDGYYTRRDPDMYALEATAIVNAIPGEVTPPDVFTAFVTNEVARQGKPIGCDQTPRNLYYLDELLVMYPHAHMVVVVRDPRDVLLSQKSRWKRRRLGADKMPWRNALRTWAGYHPITISMLWRSGVSAGDRHADNRRVTVLRFEDLLTDPEAHVKQVCEAIGVSYEPEMLDVPWIGSSHQQDQPDELGIDPASAGRWKQGGLTPTELAVCQRITGELMRRHGYEAEPAAASVLSLTWCRITWIGKSALAVILNLGRSRNLLEALRRRLGR